MPEVVRMSEPFFRFLTIFPSCVYHWGIEGDQAQVPTTQTFTRGLHKAEVAWHPKQNKSIISKFVSRSIIFCSTMIFDMCRSSLVKL